MKRQMLSSLVIAIILCGNMFATNDLSVKDKNLYGSKFGFIEKATLVIEPFGGYVEESLYLEYSERNQFTSPLLEIVHRFELPKSAVINDMWLWMGDSVMQARMYDTWSARHIYDSIAATHYDPAFLTKTGSQYELRVYPLAAGNRRKIKISFIVPTKWYGSQATAELPLKMLLANNATVKPLDILFRTQKNVWGAPLLSESPQYSFTNLKDTLNYNYQVLTLYDISGYSSLNLKFSPEFTNGYFISGYQDKSDSTYFQFGILPKDFFKVQADAKSKDVLVALDFSGSFEKNLQYNLSTYQALVDSSLKPDDNFKFIVSGNSQIVDYTGSFLPATNQNISSAFNQFKQSNLAEAIDLKHSTTVLFCDGAASANWNFRGLLSMAKGTWFEDLTDAISSIPKYDVVTAYSHGFDVPIDQTTANTVISKLDSLFLNGGRFLTYYDMNREGHELLARHYINGLSCTSVNHNAVTLYRNLNGNIGKDFPESITRNACYFFNYTDPDVKVELMDNTGNPTVISKKIKNGLIVVSGIWSMNDDAGIKASFNIPLLGLNATKNPYALNNLLSRIKDEYKSKNFSKVILLSDSDSLITKADAEIEAPKYISEYEGNHPRFMTINLLSDSLLTPSYILVNQTEYYGSGYFLERLAAASGGLHIEKHIYDWPYIQSAFSPYAIPALTSLDINTVVDNGAGVTYELREVNKMADPNKPRFFLGNTNAANTITFNISGKFETSDKDSTGQVTFIVPHDSLTNNVVVKTMLGNEKINDLFNAAPIDTAQIVKLSLLYNALTDYSALLALEPNDTLRFMRNPFDESDLNTDVAEKKTDNSDSTFISAYPNPFNGMTTLKIHLKSLSNVTATIYNILGQKVKDVVNNERLSGDRSFTWNGKNNYGINVATGFYIFRVAITNAETKKENFYTHKLMYLK